MISVIFILALALLVFSFYCPLESGNMGWYEEFDFDDEEEEETKADRKPKVRKGIVLFRVCMILVVIALGAFEIKLAFDVFNIDTLDAEIKQQQAYVEKVKSHVEAEIYEYVDYHNIKLGQIYVNDAMDLLIYVPDLAKTQVVQKQIEQVFEAEERIQMLEKQKSEAKRERWLLDFGLLTGRKKG